MKLHPITSAMIQVTVAVTITLATSITLVDRVRHTFPSQTANWHSSTIGIMIGTLTLVIILLLREIAVTVTQEIKKRKANRE